MDRGNNIVGLVIVIRVYSSQSETISLSSDSYCDYYHVVVTTTRTTTITTILMTEQRLTRPERKKELQTKLGNKQKK